MPVEFILLFSIVFGIFAGFISLLYRENKKRKELLDRLSLSMLKQNEALLKVIDHCKSALERDQVFNDAFTTYAKAQNEIMKSVATGHKETANTNYELAVFQDKMTKELHFINSQLAAMKAGKMLPFKQ
jgi:vacuolar-type H+-ATPase subunit I/STV1